MTFANRHDAGCQLAAALLAHRPRDPIVVGISRGGVPVAAELAHVLQAPLEICVVRKLFSPGSPSYAIGAVSEQGAVALDEAEIAKLRLSPIEVEHAIAIEGHEVTRLGGLLRDEPAISVTGRDAILVDDAVTSLYTLRAAARSLRAQGPATLTLAVPMGDVELVRQLRPDFDRVVCLLAEEMLVAVGTRYREFWPVSESEVVALLASARA